MAAQVPVLDLSFGLVWQQLIGDQVNLSIGIHYMFQHWMNALYSQQYADDVEDQITADRMEDLSIHGPSFTVGLSW